MEQFEKVCKGLECLISAGKHCEECDYDEHGLCGSDLIVEDALALIRQQQERIKELEAAQTARVVPLEEVLENAQKIGFPCWVEDHIENIEPAVLFPAVVTSDDIYIQYTGNDYYEGAIYHWAYNKRLRCWTQRPTDEQREAEAWKA